MATTAPYLHRSHAENVAAMKKQTALHLVPKPQHVPVQLSGRSHRLVRKAVHLFDGNACAIERGEQGTPTFGAEVERKILRGSHDESPLTAGMLLADRRLQGSRVL